MYEVYSTGKVFAHLAVVKLKKGLNCVEVSPVHKTVRCYGSFVCTGWQCLGGKVK